MSSRRRSLCAVDFSPASIVALEVARLLARKDGDADLTILHAFTPPTVTLAALDVVVAGDVTQRARREVELATQALVVQHHDEPFGVRGEVADGPAALAIVEAAKRIGAERIVLASSGRGAASRLLLGSVVDRVLRTSAIDVVVVPPSQPHERRTALRHVVCAVDFSAGAEHAVFRAAALARAHDARLHLVHVWDVPKTIERVPDLAAAIERDLSRELAGTTARHAAPGVVIESHLVRGHAPTEILALARRVGADLVVVGSSGKSRSDRLLFGSVSERVLRASHVPVYVAHVDAPRGE